MADASEEQESIAKMEESATKLLATLEKLASKRSNMLKTIEEIEKKEKSKILNIFSYLKFIDSKAEASLTESDAVFAKEYANTTKLAAIAESDEAVKAETTACAAIKVSIAAKADLDKYASYQYVKDA